MSAANTITKFLTGWATKSIDKRAVENKGLTDTHEQRIQLLENLFNRFLVDLNNQGLRPKDPTLITQLDTALKTIKN